jgi:hypothetical protein
MSPYSRLTTGPDCVHLRSFPQGGIANGVRIVHVPTLRNSRHERFAQELAAGKTADAAYVLARDPDSRSRGSEKQGDEN